MQRLKKIFIIMFLFIFPVTFLAGCNETRFQISFIVDGEVYLTINTNGNEKISMPENPTKEGYDFYGWYWDDNEWEKPFTANSLLDTPLSSDMKVYAKFIQHITHTLTHHVFKDSTCTEKGNIEYWSCSGCSKLFSDENGTTEITSVEIAIKTHNLTHHAFKDATCIENGYEEYWQCQGCNKIFSDETGQNQISNPKTIVSQGHKFGNWYETKPATYYEIGEEKRDCLKCEHYQTRPIQKLVAKIIEPTTITIDYGIIKWNGSSPFGFEVVVNGKSQIVNANQLETTFKTDDYNEVKVASINVDNTKSDYVILDRFVVYNISKLEFVDDGTNVEFTWESSDNLYGYSFSINGEEVNIDKSTHSYSVETNTLKKGDIIELYVNGLESNNIYPSKKVVLTLDQMEAPNLEINKLNIEWNAVSHANHYLISATNNITTTETTYSYDGASAGEHTITVTALGNNYLCNSSTLTFTKYEKPTISITNGLVSWNAITGQFSYVILQNDNETTFEADFFELTNRTQNYEMLLYAYPALDNTMQSDNILIGNFVYDTYYTAYYGIQASATKTYQIAENSAMIYVPNGFETKNFSNCNQDLTLIASQTPSTLSKTLIKSIIVPKNITSLPSSVFSGCDSLTQITLPFMGNGLYDTHFFGSIFGASSYESQNNSIPSSLKTVIITVGPRIDSCAFYGCTGLTSITIPESVTSIGTCAFYGCTGLTSITIPESVTSIGTYAFYNCTGLTSITIPNKVTSIGGGAFAMCKGLTNITMLESITSIGTYAFYNCTGLTSITIPESVTSIGSFAFGACTGLTSIIIPKKVTSIGDSAFYGCAGLINITIPESVTSIGDSAFYGCAGLINITIPESVTSIGSFAFYGCTGLTSIIIPESVTSIGNSAFRECVGLTSITIPESVTSIGSFAFYGCTGLTSIIIPESVTSIGNSAFCECVGLTSITIPESVTSIGRGAFQYCSRLTSVYYKGTALEWNSIDINSNNSCLTSATRYYYSETEPTSTGNYWHYNETGVIAIW